MANLTIGSNVEYTDDKGKKHKGVIHAVKRGDTGKGEVVLGYLVDTGNDVAVDEYHFDYRDREITKRINKLVGEGKTPREAATEVEKQKDLPKSKKGVDIVRQPEQVEVAPDNIRAIE